jgi:hypothetical protein
MISPIEPRGTRRKSPYRRAWVGLDAPVLADGTVNPLHHTGPLATYAVMSRVHRDRLVFCFAVGAAIAGCGVASGCAVPALRTATALPERIPAVAGLAEVPAGVAFAVLAEGADSAGADWEAAVFVDDTSGPVLSPRTREEKVVVPFGTHAVRLRATRFEMVTTTTMQSVSVPVTVPCGTGTCTQTQTQLRPVTTTTRTAVASCDASSVVTVQYEERRRITLTVALPGCSVVDVPTDRF